MAQSLTSFMVESKAKLEAFEKWWMEQHALDPEAYPLSMEDGNEGLWWEMLQEFDRLT